MGALQELNITSPEDGAGGDALGAFCVPLTQNPRTGTRWTARDEYDSIPMSNLHILTGQRVTKLLSGDRTAEGVKIIGVEVTTIYSEHYSVCTQLIEPSLQERRTVRGSRFLLRVKSFFPPEHFTLLRF